MAIEQKFMFQLGLLFFLLWTDQTATDGKRWKMYFPNVAIKYQFLYKNHAIMLHVYKCEEICDPNILSFIL